MPGRGFLVFCALCGPLLAAGPAPANPDPLPGESPFGAPVQAAAPSGQAAKSEGYELVGMVATPKGPLLSIVRQHDKRSFWIPLGATREGITVASYDARHDRAVIHADGRKLTLTMRKAAIVATENAAAEPTSATEEPAPPSDANDTPATAETPPPPDATATPAEAESTAPETPAVPAAQAEQETEARMLVSDLLEIGQQQREAYEAAEKKAAAEKTGATEAKLADEPAPPEAEPTATDTSAPEHASTPASTGNPPHDK